MIWWRFLFVPVLVGCFLLTDRSRRLGLLWSTAASFAGAITGAMLQIHSYVVAVFMVFWGFVFWLAWWELGDTITVWAAVHSKSRLARTLVFCGVQPKKLSLHLQIHMAPSPGVRLKATITEEESDRTWDGALLDDGTSQVPKDAPDDVRSIMFTTFTKGRAGEFDGIFKPGP